MRRRETFSPNFGTPTFCYISKNINMNDLKMFQTLYQRHRKKSFPVRFIFMVFAFILYSNILYNLLTGLISIIIFIFQSIRNHILN